MQWIKAHLTLVICGSVALVSVVLFVLGIVLSGTKEAIAQDAALLGSVQSSGRVNPSNARMIEEERKYQAEITRQIKDFMADAEKTSTHAPLCPDVFPAIKAQDAPVKFKNAFKEKQQDLLKKLNAQGRPTATEIQDYAEQLANLKLKQERDQSSALSPVAGDKGADRRTAPPQPRPPPVVQAPVPSRARNQEMTPQERVKEDPAAARSVIRAREIYCYATVDNLDPQPPGMEQNMPPVEAMWKAQVSLWIQEDVLGALAKLNNQAAEQLPERDRWVGQLPVKRLIYFAVGDYVPQLLPGTEGGSLRGSSVVPMDRGAQGGPPPGSAEAVFTQQPSTENVDVVQFAVGLVVEARMLLKVVDAITSVGFYTPLRVVYSAEQTNPTLTDYIYGSAPVINVRLEFEVSMLRSKYGEWMPASIKTPTSQEREIRGRPSPGRAREPERPPARGPESGWGVRDRYKGS